MLIGLQWIQTISIFFIESFLIIDFSVYCEEYLNRYFLNQGKLEIKKITLILNNEK